MKVQVGPLRARLKTAEEKIAALEASNKELTDHKKELQEEMLMSAAVLGDERMLQTLLRQTVRRAPFVLGAGPECYHDYQCNERGQHHIRGRRFAYHGQDFEVGKRDSYNICGSCFENLEDDEDIFLERDKVIRTHDLEVSVPLISMNLICREQGTQGEPSPPPRLARRDALKRGRGRTKSKVVERKEMYGLLLRFIKCHRRRRAFIENIQTS